jgi:outer membrane protein assembly factor BamB
LKIKQVFIGMILLSLFLTSISSGTYYHITKSSEECSDLELASYDPLTFNPMNHRTEDYYDIPYLNEKNTKYVPMPQNVGPIDSAWPMQSHDQNHSGRSPYNSAHNPGVEKWRFKTRGGVTSGIAIDMDDTLYFGDFSGWLYALNPDGSLKWENEAMAYITLEMPCIANNGIIYIGSHARLQAWDRNGTQLWSISLGGNIGSSPAVADDGTIYVGHMNNDMCAINPNGTIKWKYTTGSWIACDPTIHPDGTIIFGSSDTYIYALYPNGTLRWRYKTGEIVRGHASIDENGVIYMSCWDGYLYAFYVNGTLKKKFDMPIAGGETMAFGPDGTIYVTYDGLAAIDPSDWTVKWKYDYLEGYEKAFLSSPAVSADGIIYIGTEIKETRGGQIYAINPDGTLRWRKWISNTNVEGSPAIAEDGTIYIGSRWNSQTGGYGCIHAFNEYTGSNTPPTKPALGGSCLNWDREWDLSMRSTDPENNPIAYYVEWGDGTSEEDWTIEVYSGIPEHVQHVYQRMGKYTIRAKARDSLGLESDWATLTIRLSHPYQNSWIELLQNRFPNIAQILDLLNQWIINHNN